MVILRFPYAHMLLPFILGHVERKQPFDVLDAEACENL